MGRTPPPKRPGQQLGARRIDGLAMDVDTTAAALGEKPKATRSKIARGLIPHRRLGGRIVIIRSELEQFLAALPGVTVAEAIENVKARAAR